MSRRHLTILAPVVLVVLLAGLIAYAVAQAPGGGFQGGGGGQRGGGMRGMWMGMRGTPAIAVADGAVFVVVGYSIYKYDAETLELLAQADIPRPQPPAGVAAPMAPATPAGPGR